MSGKRERFIAERPELSDAAFASRVGIPQDWQCFAFYAREALGRACRIPASHIRPEEDPKLLASLVGDWDDMAVILELEQLLGVTLGHDADSFPSFLAGRFFWRKWPGPKSVGEWTIRVAEHLHSKLNAKAGPSTGTSAGLFVAPR